MSAPKPPTDDAGDGAGGYGFEELVDAHYQSLYQFAASLTRAEADACDLTQQTFYVWAAKGDQLRDASKAKSWLFTTLYRLFLKARHRSARFPNVELEAAEAELPGQPPAAARCADSQAALEALARVDQVYRAPLTLFYMEDHSYEEIAEILDVPIGTVKSRILRGKSQLQRLLRAEGAP